MATLMILPSFLSFLLSEAVASSFWISKLNKTRIPMSANDPARVIVEIVDVVTVEIIKCVARVLISKPNFVGLLLSIINNNRKALFVKGDLRHF